MKPETVSELVHKAVDEIGREAYAGNGIYRFHVEELHLDGNYIVVNDNGRFFRAGFRVDGDVVVLDERQHWCRVERKWVLW